ncbi:hypothetical protein MettiDRAFT_3019 [Methanolobus tindarius DSM 2278]|uniref:Uncharacterized protein n=1 Tax=Methanolobus tindarius DSM 2278 TaxID=1090322 RepID=W9E0Q7_METTI|nr:hypothetical protein [Methanolobus tindarius]ETA69517.1 hypothetical protein MettiDRAFT_3019 [Methanolobus tindarius DSM 2278]
MAKANQTANGVSLVKGGTDKKKNATWKTRALLWVGSCMVMASCLVGNAAAESNYSIDWTAMGDMLDGVSGIMPNFGNLIMAVVPVILILIVVGFVTGFFDALLDGIKNAFSFLKH